MPNGDTRANDTLTCSGAALHSREYRLRFEGNAYAGLESAGGEVIGVVLSKYTVCV